MKRKCLSAAALLAAVWILCALGACEALPTVPPQASLQSAEAPEAQGNALEAVAPETVQLPGVTLPQATPDPDGTVRIKLTAVGDCTLGGDIPSGKYKSFARYFNQNGADYFFANVRSIFAADDITIVNLEGPLSEATKKRGYRFNFRGKPEYVNILSGSSVEIANIANNHAYDYQEEGAQDTIAVVREKGIGVSGYAEEYYTTVKGVRVGSIGFTRWKFTTDEMAEATRAAREKCDLLIVSVHWGDEGHHEATDDQIEKGHAIIDAGADVIIGTHPHVYGGIEVYRGKTIVYSLGNFCFGGNVDPAEKNSLIFREEFIVKPDTKEVFDGGIDIIPIRISGVDKGNDFQPYVQQPDDRSKKLLNGVQNESFVDFKQVNWLSDSYILTHNLLDEIGGKQK